MKRKFLIMSILMVSASVFAAESIKLEDTVVTTGESFGTSVRNMAKDVTVITSKEIADKKALNVTEALKGVPGVTIKNMDGAAPNIDLRGSGATAGNNTLILLDGIPMSGMATFDMNQIPIDEVERIEVIQGGGAVMYGDGAIGGVVNIITKAPENKKNYGSLGGELGSWKTMRTNLNYGTKLGKLLLDTSYSGYKSLEYRDRNEEFKGKKDKRDSIWLRGKYLLDNGSIEARYSHNESKDYYTGSLNYTQYKDNPKQAGSYGGHYRYINDIFNLSYSQKITSNLDFLIYGGYYEQKNDYYSPYNNKVREFFVKPQVKYTYSKDSYLILGGDYKKGKDNKTEWFSETRRDSYAGYLMNKTTVDKLQFTQGFRHEKVELKKRENNYSLDKDYSGNNTYDLGINYLYSDTGNIYVNISTSTRVPTISELGAWYGNIKTQENKTYEIGLRDSISNTSIGISAFVVDSKNEIYYDKIFDPTSYGFNRNFDGKVRRKGVQLSLSHYFEKLTLRENLSYIEPKVRDGMYSGKEFAGVPRWQANLGGTYNFTENFLINVDMYYMGKSYAQDDFDNYFGKNPDYTTFDANISYTFPIGVEVYAGFRNLFNKKYYNAVITSKKYGSEVYYPADGRSFYTGFKYKF